MKPSAFKDIAAPESAAKSETSRLPSQMDKPSLFDKPAHADKPETLSSLPSSFEGLRHLETGKRANETIHLPSQLERPYDAKNAEAGASGGRFADDLKKTFAKAEANTSEGDKDTEKKGPIERLFSSYKERLDQTPLSGLRGYWTGNRGESKFVPFDKEIRELLAKLGLDGIEYKNAIPNFLRCSVCTTEIDNMSPQRRGKGGNFEQCDAKCAEIWNKEKRDGRSDWTARDVEKWRTENGYSWHERNDRKTCDLIPTKINDYFGHLGGVSECIKALKINREDEFDD